MLSKEFIFKDNQVTGLKTIEIDWAEEEKGKMQMNEKPNTEKIWDADLILLALGFTGPETQLLENLGITRNDFGNIDAEYGKFSTNVEGIFAAGDARRGQSLVVWAMNEGRGAALAIDRYLQGSSTLSAPMIKLGSLRV